MGISACIVCRNEADRLEPCLRSVAWVDEILVMDLESADGSAELARRCGARVIERAPLPIVEPLRNELAAAARHRWVLALDPDERVTSGLAAELRRLSGDERIDAVVIPRMNLDLGYAPSNPMHRYEGQLRMYRKDRVDWPAFPNRLPVVADERVHRVALQDALVLVHDRNRNLPEALERAIRYAPAEAAAMVEAGMTFSAAAMIRTILRTVDRQLFRARAWEDGVPGLLRAAMLVNYKVSVWIAFWQLSGARRTKADDRLVRAIGVVLEPPWRLAWTVARALGGVLVRREGPLPPAAGDRSRGS